VRVVYTVTYFDGATKSETIALIKAPNAEEAIAKLKELKPHASTILDCARHLDRKVCLQCGTTLRSDITKRLGRCQVCDPKAYHRLHYQFNLARSKGRPIPEAIELTPPAHRKGKTLRELLEEAKQ
jgi:hypothetical protein